MFRLLAIILLSFGAHCYADVASEPWPKKLGDLSAADTVKSTGFTVSLRGSDDQAGSGTGGGMVDIRVRQVRTGVTRRLHAQSVSLTVLATYHGWPQLELWGRGGGGSYSRLLYRVIDLRYVCVRIDDFTEIEADAKDKARTASIPDIAEYLYYVETRIPEKP